MPFDVAVVIPTYRPGETLLSLMSTLNDLRVPAVVADDASPCTSDPILRSVSEGGIHVSRHRVNEGIARGLNVGLAKAQELGCQWLLTLDQDSSISPDYLPTLLEAAMVAEAALGAGQVGAIGAGRIDDASGELTYPMNQECGIPCTQELIQTGTLWNVAALTSIGGFDERLRIDAVDAAACLALRQSNLKIVVAANLAIDHQIGSGMQVNFLGRPVLASGHSPERRTTIVRNRLRLFPAELRQDPIHALRTLRRLVVGTGLAVTVEDNRWQKARASVRGLLPHRNR